MIKRKSGFFTFICSLIPGAGEMYLGFMRRGTSIMILFFGIIALTSWLDLSPLGFIIPVVWCYSFFDTHNLRSLPDEDFYYIKDEFLLPLESINIPILSQKYKLILGGALILIGISVLWNQLIDLFNRMFILPDFIREFLYFIGNRIPQSLFALFIIAIGYSLIRGKQAVLEQKSDVEE